MEKGYATILDYYLQKGVIDTLPRLKETDSTNILAATSFKDYTFIWDRPVNRFLRSGVEKFEQGLSLTYKMFPNFEGKQPENLNEALNNIKEHIACMDDYFQNQARKDDTGFSPSCVCLVPKKIYNFKKLAQMIIPMAVNKILLIS
jgi:hypothetical protein